MPAPDIRIVQPVLAFDATLEDAARRAFSDLAERWYRHGSGPAADEPERRRSLLRTVVDLGFADALPAPDTRGAWPDAAVIIRAQARFAVPVDMALLLATGDREASIGGDPSEYVCTARSDAPPDTNTAAALALGRCLQISSAMQAALELSLGYVRQRRQFGRPLARFQAIQHSLAIAAEEVAASVAITDLALACMVAEGGASARLPALLDAAAIVAGRGVDVVYDVCHQVHGAIGFTREYALHRHSLDLLRWRDHLHALCGGELRCAERLGALAIAANGLWPGLTSLMKGGDSE